MSKLFYITAYGMNIRQFGSFSDPVSDEERTIILSPGLTGICIEREPVVKPTGIAT